MKIGGRKAESKKTIEKKKCRVARKGRKYEENDRGQIGTRYI
jgi:hypothetical protein